MEDVDNPKNADDQRHHVGAVIDNRYEVLSLVSSGGAGEVLKVRHREMDKIFAAKVMRSSTKPSSDSLKRFTREAQILCKLRHPNIVAVHAFGLDENVGPYLIMDLVEGVPLSTLVKQQGPMPVEHAGKLFIDICEAMSSAHKLGIVHRDIKPSNVMVMGEGDERRAVIIDFGAGKLLFDEDLQRLTGTSAMLGTPVYMSPEQVKSACADKRSDVYSMGCLMYEVLTGKPPFSAESAFELMSKHLNDIPPPPSAVNANLKIPAQLDQVITQALVKDPGSRLDTFSKIKEAVEQGLQRPTYAKLMLTPATSTKRLDRRKLLPLAVIACTLVGSAWFAQRLWLQSDRAADALDIGRDKLNVREIEQELDRLRATGASGPEIAAAQRQLIEFYETPGPGHRESLARELINLANFEISLRDYPAVLVTSKRLYDLIPTLSPTSVTRAQFYYGRALFLNYREAEAMPLLLQAREHAARLDAEERWLVSHELAGCYMKAGKFAEAEKMAKEAIELSPPEQRGWSKSRLQEIRKRL